MIIRGRGLGGWLGTFRVRPWPTGAELGRRLHRSGVGDQDQGRSDAKGYVTGQATKCLEC